MATITHDGLKLCPDCMIAAVNGDFTGLDNLTGWKCLSCHHEADRGRAPTHCPECTSEAHDNHGPHSAADLRMAAITAGLERLGKLGHLVMTSTQWGKGHDEFSSSECECCRDAGHGERYEFAILGDGPVALKPAWGMEPPVGAVAAWGARAIYTANRQSYAANYTKRGTLRKRGREPRFTVELLHDRMGPAGDPALVKGLCAWLDKVGMPRLRKECDVKFVTPDSNDRIEFTDGRYTLVASPRESYGYLYIGAWMTP